MNVIAKCKIALFEDVEIQKFAHVPFTVTERIPVECGGDIMTKDGDDYDQHSMDPIDGYCDKCGTAYYYPYGVPE